jgi:peptidyl-prolyl cis-trans isomerase SDCCAG10
LTASRQAEIKAMQENLRSLKKRTGEASDSESDEDLRKRRKGPSYLEEELSKYQTSRGRAIKRTANTRRRREEEEDLLAGMTTFAQRVAESGTDAVDGEDIANEDPDVDDDVNWLKHDLRFLIDEKEITRRAEEEYSVSH